MASDLASRILAHYLGGEEDLPKLSRADALIVSRLALPLPARALPALRRLYGRRGLAILVLTRDDHEHAHLLGSGADDVLLAAGDPLLLAARLEAALRTVEQFASPASWSRTVVRTPDAQIAVDLRAQLCHVREGGAYREILLTRKQLAALTALVRAAGRPVSWEEFFRKGWRPGRLRRRSRTLVQHILALRRKLGAAGARIKSVPGTGYRLTV